MLEEFESMRKPKSDPLGQLTHDFIILLMVKMLEKEFQFQYIFANQKNWINGPWKNETGQPTPDIVLGKQKEKHIFAVYEIETLSSLSNIAEVKSRLKHFRGIHLELVVPKESVENLKKELKQFKIAGFWSFSILRNPMHHKSWRLSLLKDSENKSKIMEHIVSSDSISI